MGAIQLSHVTWRRPGGAVLVDDISFHVDDGDRAALVGANGVGKSTILGLIAGDIAGATGTITVDGRLGVMRQLVGSFRDTTVRDLFVSLAPERVRRAAHQLDTSEQAHNAAPDDTDAALAYATAIAAWSDVGGYDLETFWDACTTRTLDLPFAAVRDRRLATLSGGEQKRLALECLLRGEDDVLLLDEPDNFLDVPGKRWLEGELSRCPKTILYVSHDRELLAATATRIVTIEGRGAWTHGASFESYHDARQARLEKLAKDNALFDAERERLEEIVKEMSRRAKISDGFAPKLKAAQTRLRHFEESNRPPENVREQKITVRLRGDRTGKKAVMVDRLGIHGLTDPFDTEIWYGERVAVLGANGAGKSHFLRLLAGDLSIPHDGAVRLGARVVPGHFSQTHEHPELYGRTLLQILERHDVLIGPAMGMLRRYELQSCAQQTFETLSGGQQARFQILLLELEGATLLLLDEPTDNLDLVSAEALEAGLAEFKGTVVAVTHDRWFLRNFDRFLVFADDCRVVDRPEPPALYR